MLMQTLGTQFIAHPPIQPFKVRVADPNHELVKGIGEFETDDELYLSRMHGKLHMLLDTQYNGAAKGFVEEQWNDDAPRPVYYIHKVGNGEVLYLNLGHCRGYYDMQPMMDRYPKIERGSWQLPQFYELLRRGIAYCAQGRSVDRGAVSLCRIYSGELVNRLSGRTLSISPFVRATGYCRSVRLRYLIESTRVRGLAR